MTDKLTFKGDRDSKTWYPVPIPILAEHLSTLIKANEYFNIKQTNPLIRNIAYSLQYVEFLDQLLKDIKMSSSLETQNIKSFVICGASIIEALFHYITVSNGHGKNTEWKSYKKFKSGEQYEIKGDKFRNETEIFIKISPPILMEMTFDQMCKKVESKKLLGDEKDLYKEINGIRKLRNKVHIHGIENPQDTDWYNFNRQELKLIKKVLHGILISSQFASSSHTHWFDYLKL